MRQNDIGKIAQIGAPFPSSPLMLQRPFPTNTEKARTVILSICSVVANVRFSAAV